jgi:hypothetical protein
MHARYKDVFAAAVCQLASGGTSRLLTGAVRRGPKQATVLVLKLQVMRLTGMASNGGPFVYRHSSSQ